jgi:hypothetical protein
MRLMPYGSARRDLLEFSLAFHSQNREIRYGIKRCQAGERCKKYCD